MAEAWTLYPHVLKTGRVCDTQKTMNDPAVQGAIKAVSTSLGDTGRVLVRQSGTEPVIRVMVEAENNEICKQYVDQIIHVIEAGL